MVYAYLLITCFLMGIAVWTAKYYSESCLMQSADNESDSSIIGVETSTVAISPGIIEIEGSGDDRPYFGGGKPEHAGGVLGDKIGAAGATAGPGDRDGHLVIGGGSGNPGAAFVGNGWWNSDLYSGWQPGYYPGAGSGSTVTKKPTGAAEPGWYPGDVPPGGPGPYPGGDLESWVQSFLHVTGERPGGGYKGWIFGVTTTVSWVTLDHEGRDMTSPPHSEDHLRPPPGGWGVDYDAYVYHVG